MTKTQQIPTDTMSVDKHYVKQQAKWVKEVGLKVGDTVLLVQECTEFRRQHTDEIATYAEIGPEFIQQPIFVDEIRNNFIIIADREQKLHPTVRYGRLVPFYLLIKINE